MIDMIRLNLTIPKVLFLYWFIIFILYIVLSKFEMYIFTNQTSRYENTNKNVLHVFL